MGSAVRNPPNTSGYIPAMTWDQIAKELRVDRGTVIDDFKRAMRKLAENPECERLVKLAQYHRELVDRRQVVEVKA